MVSLWTSMPIYFLVSIRVLPSVVFCFTLKIYRKGAPFYNAWESRGLCGISKGGGKGGKPAFGFPRFPRTGFFHSPAAAAFCFLQKHRSSLSSCGLQARVPIRTSTAVLPPPDRTRVQTEGVRPASWYPS